MIPQAFLERMKTMLGDEYDAFCRALEEDAVRSFRKNTLKTDTLDSILAAMDATPIADCANGYQTTSDKVGTLYPHHAGMIYMQDPSAMTTVQAVTIEKMWRVLDACAAPGGKTTQIASYVTDGLVVANEPNAQRSRILQGNIERMGVKNAIVTQSTPDVLAKTYTGYFDLVLTDAPCSGEGMFRKYAVAEEEWSQENVTFCAKRQREILNETAKCVKEGGYLLYSTCTFSKEENEDTVADFLMFHPDFALRETADCVQKRTVCGIATDAFSDLAKTRRFYPHIAKGEGQYIALMQRIGSAPVTPKSAAVPPLARQEQADAKALLAELLQPQIAEEMMQKLENGTLCLTKINSTVYLSPCVPLPDCRIVTCGTALADIVGKRLVPHHHFYSAYGKDFANQLRLQDEDTIYRYLRGEEIAAPDTQNGYCAVLVFGCPTGGGKVSGGRLKNHYPKGLRNH